MNTINQFFKGWKEGMNSFGKIVSGIINAVLLSIVYFVGVGISWLLLKVKKKNLFQKNHSKKSYWTKHEKSKENYFRQF